MLVVALTGGLGAGKSMVASAMREKGATVLDLDDIARQLLEDDPTLATRIAAEFPTAARPDGSLDRDALAWAAFGSTKSAERLNAIVHPAIAAEVGPALAELRLMPAPPQVVVIEIPLLVEAPVFAELVDVVLAVEAPEEVRIRRAVEAGMSLEDAQNRVACQASDEERRTLADTVIENVGDADALRRQVDATWESAIAPHVG